MITVFGPHPDDIAFSLAITVNHLAKSGHRLNFVRCFTVSEYGPNLDTTDRKRITEVRRGEYELFGQKMVGRGVKNIDLELLDAPLRGYDYERLFDEGDIEGEDLKLVSRIEEVAEKEASRSKSIIFPLALGDHIDHKIVSMVGVNLCLKGFKNVLFYEDLPYAYSVPEEGIKKRVSFISDRCGYKFSKRLTKTKDLSLKRLAISLFKSQLKPSDYDGIVGYSERMKKIHKSYCERLWQLEP